MTKRKALTDRSLDEDGDEGRSIDLAIQARVGRRDLCRTLARASMAIITALGPRMRRWFASERAKDDLAALREAAYFDVGVSHGVTAAAAHEMRALPPAVERIAWRMLKAGLGARPVGGSRRRRGRGDGGVVATRREDRGAGAARGRLNGRPAGARAAWARQCPSTSLSSALADCPLAAPGSTIKVCAKNASPQSNGSLSMSSSTVMPPGGSDRKIMICGTTSRLPPFFLGIDVSVSPSHRSRCHRPKGAASTAPTHGPRVIAAEIAAPK